MVHVSCCVGRLSNETETGGGVKIIIWRYAERILLFFGFVHGTSSLACRRNGYFHVDRGRRHRFPAECFVVRYFLNLIHILFPNDYSLQWYPSRWRWRRLPLSLPRRRPRQTILIICTAVQVSHRVCPGLYSFFFFFIIFNFLVYLSKIIYKNVKTINIFWKK